MKNLVIVEASGKIVAMRATLKAIGITAEVLATVGHVADNATSLNKIGLDHNLRETNYGFKPDRQALLEKLQRAASTADRIYLAMDDDQEGDVIAYDVSRYLSEHSNKFFRVRLRAMSGAELKAAFAVSGPTDFKLAADKGICRRIVDRAIGATFTLVSERITIPVGRVQSSLLACIDKELPQMGRYVIPAKLQDGFIFHATVPIYNKAECADLETIALSVAAGSGRILDYQEINVAVSAPWGYEEVVAESSARLRIGIEQAADAFQEAYERGRVSYPRARKNGFTRDAVEVAAALAKQNRSVFDPNLIRLRKSDAADSVPHESPRPIDGEMMLGRPMSVLDTPEAVAVLVARNMLECGQLVKARKLRVEVEGRELEFSYIAKPPLRNWKDRVQEPGYSQFSRDYAILKYMADHELGRPSTVVNHVTKFLQRTLVNDDGSNLGLTHKAKRWLDHARSVGFSESTSNEMEKAFADMVGDPHVAAMEILGRFEMLTPVLERIMQKNSNEISHDYEEFSF